MGVPRVLLVGAGGAVGRRAVRRLVCHDIHVTALMFAMSREDDELARFGLLQNDASLALGTSPKPRVSQWLAGRMSVASAVEKAVANAGVDHGHGFSVGVFLPTREPAEAVGSFKPTDGAALLEFALACRQAGIVNLTAFVGSRDLGDESAQGSARAALEAMTFERVSVVRPHLVLPSKSEAGLRTGSPRDGAISRLVAAFRRGRAAASSSVAMSEEEAGRVVALATLDTVEAERREGGPAAVGSRCRVELLESADRIGRLARRYS